MHDISVIHTKPRRCLEFLTVGILSIKTMCANARGSGSYNKTKDWALVQTIALAINQGFNVKLG